MAKFDVISIGGSVKDVTFYTDAGKIISTPENLTAQQLLAFEYGAKISVKEAYFNLGGGASNIAVSLSRLGFKVAAMTKVGNDEIGKEFLKKFRQEKVSQNLVQIDKKELSGFSFILATNKRDREHIVFVTPGANKNFVFKPPLNLKTDWFYLTSLVNKDWFKQAKEIFNFAAKENIKIIWNPGRLQLQAGKKALTPFLSQAKILILNKDEAIELALSGIKLGRKNPNYLNRPLYLLNILSEWGPKILIITNGKKGAWAYDGKNIYQQKIYPAKTVDTTGVGDAFGSSFLAGYIIEKNNIILALKWGMINSASVVNKVGAQNGLLKREIVEKKLLKLK
ncbi:MAG: hypothetical protein A2729_04840 [Candidatus Buchananbacteria bacterium RIFCSPHIGHO2_01_FULL_39_14]|uniref:Carbohydrate kinase PfkB domain-containing protein n=1 Tax=Candidatus Buchananbacteria bacterium RIFCSPHIGHO2_01_FULL_39_14 TaxID=1797532 RepID=A0A1G1XT96_9BACT|nr:MAG: hypothetical protein A2729_04840 [Candidatus Buchananbacteria bacterium RIFCSPHIGHO2_01_FULL_39_14]OGY49590.1 MAG: hypothetical protein A3D39_02155 [Candidatus Buchananbacteria bacterium RIFCSPHIGHO2_02_FULL_39_17]